MTRPTGRPVALAGLVTTLVLVACGIQDDPPRAACGPVESPEVQGGGHLIGDNPAPVPYTSTPGTSGWHASGQPRTGVVREPLPEPEIVSVLEHGQIVAAYDPGSLPPDQVVVLEELAEGPLEGDLTVTPFEEEMGAPLVLNAWGTRQACAVADPEAITRFVERHAEDDHAH